MIEPNIIDYNDNERIFSIYITIGCQIAPRITWCVLNSICSNSMIFKYFNQPISHSEKLRTFR